MALLLLRLLLRLYRDCKLKGQLENFRFTCTCRPERFQQGYMYFWLSGMRRLDITGVECHQAIMCASPSCVGAGWRSNVIPTIVYILLCTTCYSAGFQLDAEPLGGAGLLWGFLHIEVRKLETVLQSAKSTERNR